jgi:hypothetical protein
MMRAKDRPLVWLISVLLTAAGEMFLASCDQISKFNNGTRTAKQTDIVAPPSEKSFPEKYHLNIALPMRETEFLVLYGDRDPVRHTGEAWRAFTDKNHPVIYIENRFAYTGPDPPLLYSYTPLPTYVHNTSYTYDANGNVTGDGSLTLTWTPYNMVAVIVLA